MADTITLMKQRILDMAISGLLVEQREKEGTAKELLFQIKKERMIENNKMDTDKKLKTIKDDEIPFEIPNSWEWVRFTDVAILLNGRAYKKHELLDDGETPVLRVGNFFTNKNWYYSNLKLEENKYCNEGDLLYAWSASFGPKIWSGPKSIFHYHIWKVDYSKYMCKKYLYYWFLKDVIDIKNITTGSTMVHVTKQNMEKRVFPLPPIAEQERIVEKIESSFAIINKINEQKEGALHTIKHIRKTALQNAIRGLLVEQGESDEPASELMKKMKAEKEQLIKEKKIKKEKILPNIEEVEIPFDIPESWEWVRLKDIGEIIGGGTPKTSINEYWEDGNVAWISPADLTGYSDKYISHGRKSITELGLQKSSARLLPTGTVLFSSRAPIGYIAIANNEISTNQGFKSIVPYIMELNQYIYYYLKAFTDNIKDRSSGTTFKEISGTELSKSLFPIPPLTEQKRIVTKLNQIMELCDKMEEILDGSRNEVISEIAIN